MNGDKKNLEHPPNQNQQKGCSRKKHFCFLDMGTTPYLKFEITICDFKSLGRYYNSNLGKCQQKKIKYYSPCESKKGVMCYKGCAA